MKFVRFQRRFFECHVVSVQIRVSSPKSHGTQAWWSSGRPFTPGIGSVIFPVSKRSPFSSQTAIAMWVVAFVVSQGNPSHPPMIFNKKESTMQIGWPHFLCNELFSPILSMIVSRELVLLWTQYIGDRKSRNRIYLKSEMLYELLWMGADRLIHRETWGDLPSSRDALLCPNDWQWKRKATGKISLLRTTEKSTILGLRWFKPWKYHFHHIWQLFNLNLKGTLA